MGLNQDRVVSAQVLLPSASGRLLDAETIITSENIAEYAPSTEIVAKVTQAFIERGFDVGEMIGISVSISAPVATFEEVFETRLRQEQDGGIRVVREDGSADYEVPLSALPDELVGAVVSVTFVPPPAFGPTEFLGP